MSNDEEGSTASDDENESRQEIAVKAFEQERPTKSKMERRDSDVNRVPSRTCQNGNSSRRRSNSKNDRRSRSKKRAFRKRSASKRKERSYECCARCCPSCSLPPLPPMAPMAPISPLAPSKPPRLANRGVCESSITNGSPEYNKRFSKNEAVRRKESSDKEQTIGRLVGLDWYERTVMQIRDQDEDWTDDDERTKSRGGGVYGFVINKAAEYIAVAGVTGLVILASQESNGTSSTSTGGCDIFRW